jgi:hypothetical protein
MKKILSLTVIFAMIMSIAGIALACEECAAVASDADSARNTIKYISNLQNAPPTPYVPAPKVQLSWLAKAAGNTVEHFNNANFTADTVGAFSYQFENENGTIKGRVQGVDGVIRVFALRPNGAYGEVFDPGGEVENNLTNIPDAVEVWEFATAFTQFFDSITATGHDHGNHTGYAPATNKVSAERFPISPDYTAAENPEKCIVFVYNRDDLGGMMSAMIYEETIKYISNLQNATPTPYVPVPKAQLSWLAKAAGNTVEHFNNANFTADTVGAFSYQFENEDGTIKGRVQGVDGVIRVFALRPNGAYGEVFDPGGEVENNLTNIPNAAEVWEFATAFTQFFDSITATGHDHGNHTGYAPATNKVSAERFPISPDYTAAENPEKCIVFVYNRDDLGGMMSAMIYEETIKYISNLQNATPTPYVPAPKVQLSWLAKAAGNTVEHFNNANFTADTVGAFSYQFENEDGTIKGRVQGVDGVIRVFALRPNGAYGEVFDPDGEVENNLTNIPNAAEVWEFATAFTQFFDSITATGHDHGNHTGYAPATNKLSAERFPISPDYTAADNPEKCIVFVYNRDNLGGMMSAMILCADFDGVRADPQPEFRLGFVRGAKSITINDALEILKYLAKLDSVLTLGDTYITAENAMRAAKIVDPNGARPTISDALEILKYLAKLGVDWI